MKVVKRECKGHYPTYDLEGLTLGKLLAIYQGLVEHDTLLAREMVEYLRMYCPEEVELVTHNEGYG